jgi:hypothetical protein
MSEWEPPCLDERDEMARGVRDVLPAPRPLPGSVGAPGIDAGAAHERPGGCDRNTGPGPAGPHPQRAKLD